MIFVEATNRLINITDENNSFSISKPVRWRNLNYLEIGIIEKLQNLLKIRSQKDIELHVKQPRKNWDQTKIGDKEYKVLDFHTFKKEKYEKIIKR